LPGDAPFVLAPTACTFLAATTDDCVPVAVGFLLIISSDLEREGFVMVERGPAIEAETGAAGDCEFDRQQVARLAGQSLGARWTAPIELLGKVSASKRAAASTSLSYHRQTVFLVIAIACPLAFEANTGADFPCTRRRFTVGLNGAPRT
jgi:hypothetical protein